MHGQDGEYSLKYTSVLRTWQRLDGKPDVVLGIGPLQLAVRKITAR